METAVNTPRKMVSDHVMTWLRLNRPDIPAEDRQYVRNGIVSQILPEISGMTPQGISIVVSHWLNDNYYMCGYRLVREVFEEEFPVECRMFQQTPIMFEVVDEILGLCLKAGIISANSNISAEEFYDEDKRKEVAKVVKEIIS